MTDVQEKFKRAFAAELELYPGTAPGPKALALRMGWNNTRNLPGRVSGLRITLLEEAGFVKTYSRWGAGRWVKR